MTLPTGYTVRPVRDHGQTLVGAALSMDVEGVAWISDLVVLKPWRGRGIGQALLGQMFSYQKPLGAPLSSQA